MSCIDPEQILQKVLELLQAARAKSPEKANVSASGKNPKTKSKRDASQAVRNDKISNLFACLQLEEPSSSPLGKDGPPPSYKSAVGIPIANFRLENEGDESAFATWCCKYNAMCRTRASDELTCLQLSSARPQ